MEEFVTLWAHADFSVETTARALQALSSVPADSTKHHVAKTTPILVEQPISLVCTGRIHLCHQGHLDAEDLVRTHCLGPLTTSQTNQVQAIILNSPVYPYDSTQTSTEGEFISNQGVPLWVVDCAVIVVSLLYLTHAYSNQWRGTHEPLVHEMIMSWAWL